MTDFTAIDNPVWHALTTEHQSLARGDGLARRYPSAVSPLGALREPTAQAFADLAALVGPGEKVVFFNTEAIEVPDTWELIHSRWIDQMACTAVTATREMPLLELREEDVPEMLALTAATEPGPFLPETIRMGRYFGIRSSDGRLAAMAGERLRLSRFMEISAVCTDPQFRGRGYALALVASVAARNLAEGRTPFLHVKTENGAKVLYEKIGFRFRRAICVTVVGPR